MRKTGIHAITCFWALGLLTSTAQSELAAIGLYRLFETRIENEKPYTNKFADVDLKVSYIAPSGREWNFPGFFDGDGRGGGDSRTGNIWKLRFMPDEPGTWSYVYQWSDNTPGGRGSFTCVKDGAGKGILRAYEKNPHWFAYNGTEPVWLKSYYETGHGVIAQDFDWVVEHVYGEFIAHGYNHLQVNWLLSLCCFKQYYLDGPEPETFDLTLYEEGKPSSTMNLNVWHLMERHLGFLNDHDIGVHMFLGFDGGRNEGPAWDKLDEQEKDFYVRYVVSRLAPYANIAGWNFVWEVDGHREDYELGLARLLKKYDVFEHLRTYEDEFPRENEYHRPEYTFAAIENHGIAAPTKDLERHYWKEPWTHHMAVIEGFRGKPVYMSEGNALWRRFWHERTGATQDHLRRAAWACAAGGASFNWNGHLKEYELYAGGPIGLPFNEENPFQASEKAIDILTRVMNEEVAFYRMTPQDDLLKQHDAMRVWALVETGRQYLVFAGQGESFAMQLAKGEYLNNIWIDAKTGEKTKVRPVVVSNDENDPVLFRPPTQKTDWVLILRTLPIREMNQVKDGMTYDVAQVMYNSDLDMLPNTRNTATERTVSDQRYKIGVCDWMILKRQKLGAFERTHEIGAQGVEVDMGSLGQRETFANNLADPAVRQQFLDAAKKFDLEICSIAMSGFYAQSFAERPTVERMIQDCIDTMKHMKVKVAFLPLGVQGDLVKHPELRPIIVERLKTAGTLAEEAHVVIGVETALDAAGDVKLLEDIGSPAIRIYFNFANALQNGRDLCRELQILGKDRICQIHCTDQDGVWLQDNERVNMPKVKETLDEMGWSGWLVIERSRSAKNTRDVVGNFSANTTYLKSIFQTKL
ncbi:MAG: DUF5060 domain-containing protein [Sedimentisphaerales bacterium]|nr:DUF5060 domain-containing protein [Sedimentisphaerales bacterium]